MGAMLESFVTHRDPRAAAAAGRAAARHQSAAVRHRHDRGVRHRRRSCRRSASRSTSPARSAARRSSSASRPLLWYLPVMFVGLLLVAFVPVDHHGAARRCSTSRAELTEETIMNASTRNDPHRRRRAAHGRRRGLARAARFRPRLRAAQRRKRIRFAHRGADGARLAPLGRAVQESRRGEDRRQAHGADLPQRADGQRARHRAGGAPRLARDGRDRRRPHELGAGDVDHRRAVPVEERASSAGTRSTARSATTCASARSTRASC